MFEIGLVFQFRKIHEDENIDDEDKFQYLVQSVSPGSLAQPLLESFSPSKVSYEKAREQLKSRFVKDELFIKIYVRELLNLVLKQATNRKTGISLVDRICII